MIELDIGELKWAAGFYDGEGSCSVQTVTEVSSTGSRVRKHTNISVSQVRLEPLYRFHKAVNYLGNMQINRRTTTVSSWDSTRFEHVQSVICMLWPFLCEPKREQILLTVNTVNKHAIDMGYNTSYRKIPIHGTVSMYSNYGCRCTPCRGAQREYDQSRKEHKRIYDIKRRADKKEFDPFNWLNNL